MTAERLNIIRNKLKNANPLIHSITNPISINQCANAVLAVGAQPIMAEHPGEVCKITASAKALLVNLGNITDVRMESVMLSAKVAKENNIPYVLDAVGVACSELRREFAHKLIKNFCPDIIKGNYSEIKALENPVYSCSGVDAEGSVDEEYISTASLRLARRHNTVILASGKTDIITDGKKLIHIKNGTPQLARITGSGCMLGVLCGCYLSVCSSIEAAALACGVLGICGELSETDKGNASFAVSLMDNLSVLSDADFEKYFKSEEKEIEKY